MKFLLCVFFLPVVTSLRLTPRENRELRKTCGRHYLRPDSFGDFRFKSYKGRRVRPTEYPWLVTVLSYDDNGDGMWCSGVAISNRHILTAAHCIVNATRFVTLKTTEECQGHRTMREQTWIKDRRECPEPNEEDRCDKHAAKVRTVHPGFNKCTNENDLAVLEMSSDVSRNHLVPICMPRPWEKLAGVLQAAGSGSIQRRQRRTTFPVRRPRYTYSCWNTFLQ
ncbi:hypothetical protein Q1695_000636 [Nippostrongylus brasiliensis]|nr:hypothetical protein Q1695_000636 [Nippostrongylus brasiliensis]